MIMPRMEFLADAFNAEEQRTSLESQGKWLSFDRQRKI
jgi:hypothetical protein